MMSVRPDVLPQAALNELAILQDSVKPFATTDAISIIEKELGAPLGEFFEEISEQPVAAASLAQVYNWWDETEYDWSCSTRLNHVER
jgi:predicted unusual protein kinase regulating ubiquinone biosynthesis (AarF/ABC1/UbiB family)